MTSSVKGVHRVSALLKRCGPGRVETWLLAVINYPGAQVRPWGRV